MKKTVRITLYLLSMITIFAVVVLIVFRGNQSHFVSMHGNLAEQGDVVTSNDDVEAGENTGEQGENGGTDIIEQVASETEPETELVTETETELNEETVLFFGGDVLVNKRIADYYDSEGITRIVAPELLEEMVNADITMVNHEFQFSNRGTPMEDKQYTFEYDPAYVTILQDMGIDVVSLANNHSLDFGKEALIDTMETLDGAGILYAGAGTDKERAEEIQIIEKNGMKFGFVAATRVIPVASWNVEYGTPGLFAAYDYTGLVEVVAEAEELCDYVTVYIHWGIEREAYPEDYQRDIATRCINAGADLIIGSHPHVLQGVEYIENVPVFYSLGNYVFNDSLDRTAGVKVIVQQDGSATYQLLPANTKSSCTALMDDAGTQNVYQYMNDISFNVSVDGQGYVTDSEE